LIVTPAGKRIVIQATLAIKAAPATGISVA
jgi:hypothetical protein